MFNYQRSFTQEQSLDIMKFLYQKIRETVAAKRHGKYIVLLLMYTLGLRTHEAINVTFGQFVEYNDSKEYYLNIPQWENTLDYHVARNIPVPAATRTYILLCQYDIIKTHGSVSVDYLNSLPIACGKTENERCTIEEVRQAGAELFEYLGMSDSLECTEKELAHIMKDVAQNELAELALIDKEPIGYFFRRDFGTQLYILGVSESMSLYLLGHIKKTSQNKMVYDVIHNNKEVLLEVKEVLDKRALPISSELQKDIETPLT